MATLLLGALALALPAPLATASPAIGPPEPGATRAVMPDGSAVVSLPLIAIDALAGAPEGAPGREFSPAGCRIVYVDTPHGSRWVLGAIKVNAKVQCEAAVPSLSLTVNMINTTVGERAAGPRNVTKDQSAFVENFDTWVSCTDPRPFRFQGHAGAVSIENGRPYANVAFGRVSGPLPCGNDDV